MTGPLLYWTFGLQLTDSKMMPFLRSTFVPGLLPAVITGSICWSVKQLWPSNTWLYLGLHCCLAATVYMGAILWVCPPDERDDLRRILAKVKGWLPGRAAT